MMMEAGIYLIKLLLLSQIVNTLVLVLILYVLDQIMKTPQSRATVHLTVALICLEENAFPITDKPPLRKGWFFVHPAAKWANVG